MKLRDDRPVPTLAQWRERALAAERALDLAAASPPVVSATGPREDVASGNVWPDASDPEYVEWLAQRVRDLERQLGVAERLLDRYDRWATSAVASLDEVVVRLIVEEHGPPPHRPKTP